MTAEENKTVVRTLWEGLFNRGDVALAHDLIAPDFVNHAIPGAAPGPEALAQAARVYRAAFPDGWTCPHDWILLVKAETLCGPLLLR